MDKRKARKKAERIVGRMTAYEKISQLLFNSPAIERLGINEYNWWNEAAPEAYTRDLPSGRRT